MEETSVGMKGETSQRRPNYIAPREYRDSPSPKRLKLLSYPMASEGSVTTYFVNTNSVKKHKHTRFKNIEISTKSLTGIFLNIRYWLAEISSNARNEVQLKIIVCINLSAVSSEYKDADEASFSFILFIL